MSQIRIGQGVDVHAWEIPHNPAKPLLLGGVKISECQTLRAHSDGDVLLHAVVDALCGAIGEGDIGELFPDTSPKWKDIDSKTLVQTVLQEVQGRGWKVGNVDTTVVCETPRLSPHKREIQRSLASLLEVDESRVGVKATTCEGLGFLGRSEGVMATAVVLLERRGGGE
ncbi:2-C-methyl-D-erythritol 2,4-cyclodiphosphate synthase [bacterium]|nr:2-C-methyl-D-erythritol 2,4-cyclodiphosphate synthase [bacterium]